MEHELIKLLLLVCDFYDKHSVLKEERLSNNHQPLFSDQELLTMYLFGHLQSLTTQRQISDYFVNHWSAWFPLLRAYKTVNHRLNQLVPAFELLIEQLLLEAAWQIQPLDDRLVDSLPVMLAKGTRSNRACVALEIANTGFCATKQQHYRGVKLHFMAARRVNTLLLPERIYLSEATQHDLSALCQINPHLCKNCALFADKAYFHAKTQTDFKEQGCFLVASYKRHRNEPEQNVPTLNNRFVATIRQPLESLFHWLIQKTDLRRASSVCSTQGLKVHCYGKLAVACLLLTFYF